MSDARTAVLARLRAAQRTTRLPPAQGDPRLPAGEPRGAEECLERFRQELDALGVANHLESSAAGVRARVAAEIEGRRVLSWDPERLPYELGTLLHDPVLGRSPRAEQAEAEIGLTGCDAAIAETGSLVLLSAAGQSRSVSLLPPVHLAVVRRTQLRYSMAEFFRTQEESMARAASCTFVTGPSRTADIELTLTLGVHGPGQVIVVIGP